MKILKLLGIFVLLGIIVGGFFAYRYYGMYFEKNVPSKLKSDLVQIPTGSTFEDLVKMLKEEEIIIDEANFRTAASYLNYTENIKAGQYKIEPNITSKRLVTILKTFGQTPVQFVIHNKRTLEQVAGHCGRYFEADSLEFLDAIMDEAFWAEHDYELETAMSAFIPNTYQIYWNTSPKAVLLRMIEEHDKFWDKENRRAKAEAMGYTPKEVYTLASIVETESQHKPERPRIAGVYINRLDRGIPLQADPSIVFALGDFSLKRILKKHLQVDSPYNTYKNAGLPPGPIYMSSISSIDAVLNYEEHDYLYFCAKPDFSRTHNFAKTLSAHNVNARNFHKWLNKRGVR